MSDTCWKILHIKWYLHLSSFSIYILCLSICLFVSNKRQNGWTDPAQIFCGKWRFMNDPRYFMKSENFFYNSLRELGILLFLFVCLCPINVKTTKLIGPNICVAHQMAPGKFMKDQNFKILPPSKFDCHNIFKNSRNFL